MTLPGLPPLRRPHLASSILAPLALLVLVAAACSAAAGPDGGAPADGTAPGSPTPSSPAPRSAGSTSSAPTSPPPSGSVRSPGVTAVRVVVGGTAFAAELDDTPTARDLAARLPVTLRVNDLGGVEKTGRLPFALTTDGAPRGSDPDVGALGYYAPGEDLVLYHGDVGYHAGIVVLGRFTTDITAVGDLPDGTEVTIERA